VPTPTNTASVGKEKGDFQDGTMLRPLRKTVLSKEGCLKNTGARGDRNDGVHKKRVNLSPHGAPRAERGREKGILKGME